MDSYFYDEKGNIRESLLTSKAKKWAESFIEPKVRKDALNMSQLRKFHIEVKSLENRLKNIENAESTFLKYKPKVKMLKSKAAYACPKKGKRKVPEEFREYIEEMVNNVNNWEEYKAFSLCFESVVGYFAGEGGRMK